MTETLLISRGLRRGLTSLHCLEGPGVDAVQLRGIIRSLSLFLLLTSVLASL